MGGVRNRDDPTRRSSPRPPSWPATMPEENAVPEDDEYEDGDFATPKQDRGDPDDEPL